MSCRRPDCDIESENFSTCCFCREQYHNLCLGEPDEPRSPTRMPAVCQQCAGPILASSTPIATSFLQTNELLDAVSSFVHREPLTLPEYGALDHEDPNDFLRRCELQFNRRHTDEACRVDLAAGQLRGAATIWWASIQDIGASWGAFSSQLKREFDSPQRLRQLKQKLYGQEQGPHEAAEAFLIKKRKLLRRLEPAANELETLASFIDLLRPELRVFVLYIKATTAEDFIRLVSETEQRLPPAQPTRSRDLPQCRFCPERHYHSECPVAARRRTNNGGRNGNRGNGRNETSGSQQPRPEPTTGNECWD